MGSDNVLHTLKCCTCRLHQGASNICGTDWLPHANDPCMCCTSLWACLLPSPNNNGRPCRGSSKHPNLTSADMLGGRPPMCASMVCPSNCNGSAPQSRTCVTCGFVSNTKARIVYWQSSTSATHGIGGPTRICRLWRNIGPIETPFLGGVYCAKGTTSTAGFDPTQGCARMGGAGWHTIRDKLLIRQRHTHGCAVRQWGITMKTAHSNGVKMPKVLHEVNTGMEPVQKHTYPNCP